MDRLGFVPERVMEFPRFKLKAPEPLAAWLPLAVLGLITRPAVLPVAVMLALTLTLFEAVKVSVVLALHATVSFTLMLPPLPPPVTGEAPVLLKMVKFVELRSPLS